MNAPIFVRTRHDYGSYADWWRLVDLSGFKTIYVDEVPQYDQRGQTLIVTPLNAEWQAGWPNARARIIHYELELRHDWRALVDTPPGIEEVWCGDAWLAHKINARYVPIGSHYGLNIHRQDAAIEKSFDVAFVAYQVGRRQTVTQELLSMGLHLAPRDNLWGNARSTALMASKVMLHVHQMDGFPAIAPLRWCLAAAHGLPMLTEYCDNRGVFGYPYMLMSEYKYLAQFTRLQLRDNAQRLRDMGEALQRLLCEDYTFRKSIEDAL